MWSLAEGSQVDVRWTLEGLPQSRPQPFPTRIDVLTTGQCYVEEINISFFRFRPVSAEYLVMDDFGFGSCPVRKGVSGTLAN